ncbi:hypothetical protein MGYG_07223 [Nannizzia gypsea CBS 118893]|uniref:Uncharacterized protein n=1 Tax=Arthroderma gypseum (strain ATCC MYA-4604 / CBS 118893) TaxID=535722 RepID=E4V2F1_ARTGP|nr:hypothetical protein MGYG_07223 [Nannizzia gypsea CBS 118893]EFR04216.1 hypothetical protein MGYG_07223 [Nannizzia gypsea CBS 118893]
MAVGGETKSSHACLALTKIITKYITYLFWPTPVVNTNPNYALSEPSGWEERQPFINALQTSNLTEKHCGAAVITYLNKTDDYLSPQETKELAVLLEDRDRFVTHKELLIRQNKAPNKSIVSRRGILEILAIEQRVIFSGMACEQARALVRSVSSS